MGFFGGIWDGIKDGANAVGEAVGNAGTSPDAPLEAERKRLLQQQAAQAGGFADQSQQGYQQLGQQGNAALSGLQGLAQGQNSVSALQLQQGLQQNVAAQRAMAASASPANAAMAARTAAIQSGRLGAGLAGQQAVAGLQERNQAQQQYAQLLQGLRGQDLNATLGSRQAAITGYGAQNAGAPAPSFLQQYGPMVMAGMQAAAMSDRRLKTDVRDGSDDADKSLKGLKAHFFRYKDEKHGSGARVGVMAQDLERAGLGHAVINTPAGKAVHGGHLATALAAMLPGIDKRLGALEKGK